MIIVVSPAKTLDYESDLPKIKSTDPRFVDEAQVLTKKLKKMSSNEIGKLMSISPALAELNSERFKSWKPEFNDTNSRPSLFAFKGDVYLGLEAATLSSKDLKYAQDHLRMLSGLYGVLRPFDLMQPYRLEMGTKLPIQKSKNLYEYWDDKITESINADLAKQKSKILVNLASNEYFGAIKKKKIDGDIITPVFKDEKNGKYKVISFFAKRARGSMARYIIQNKIKKVENLKGFDTDGYQYNEEMSKEAEPVFTREEQKS